jgi:signal transduction histidine kinase
MGPETKSAAPGDLPVRLVADALSEGVAVLREGRIVFANAQLRAWSGRGDLSGVEASEIFAGEAPPGPGRATLCRVPREGGKPRHLEIRGHALCDEQTLLIACDVTHVRALEEQMLRAGRDLHEARRELEQVKERARRESEEREDLLTVVAHELRTPVTVISGYNKLLLSEKVGPLGEEQRHFLEESARSCQRLNTFIGNLLESTRQAAGDAPLEVREAAIATTLDGVVAYLKPLLEARGLEVELQVDARAPSARYDPVRVEQVLTNLISNAIKYASEGGVIQVVTRPLEVEGRPFLEVSVGDDGPGVEPEDRERIFLPYVRTGAARGAGGLGLGLAICKRIVEAHGGSIRVEPRAGGGSAFVFTLPAPSGWES